jgi:PAS domain S-box-containing protein
MSQKELDILRRALEREKNARKAAEKILEEKSRELYTTSQKIEQLLVEKSSQLQGVFENILDAYVVMDLDGNIIKFNDAATNLFGYDIKKNPVNVKDLVFNDDKEYAWKSFHNLKTKGFFKNYEARIYTKTKEVKWVHINASVIYDKNKFPIAAQGIVRDITLERKNAIILDLINNLTKTIFGKTDINEIAWEIVNSIAQYLNSDDCVIYLVDHRNQFLEQIAAYGDKKNSFNNSIKNKLILPLETGIVGSVAKFGKSEIIKDTSKDLRYFLDDKKRFSEITIPIISNGKVIGVIDSEHKDKNYFTNEHLNTLEGIANLVAIKIRTALSNREREKADAYNIQLLAELEKSNDELHQYAHIVSHDLKSPLRSIDALINWIKEDNILKFDEASLQNIKLIEITLEKMEQLISDVLNYSSVTTDNSKMIDVNTNILVKELIHILYIPAHIELKICNPLPIVRGDKIKLQQVFQNLISNAVKFIDKKKGIIEIDVISRPNFYEFSIKDNGIGIEKKYYKKIFEIFHSLNKGKDSTGIGLSIVKKIINLHDGDIWLESEPSIGTTFNFTLKKELYGTA